MKNKNVSKSNSMWTAGKTGNVGLIPFIAVCICAAAAIFVLQNSGLLGNVNGNEQAQVRFNALQSDNTITLQNGNGEYCDWFSIENYSDKQIDLKGMSVMSGTDFNSIYSFPSVILQPGETVTVFCAGKDAAKNTHSSDLTAPFSLPAAGGRELSLLDKAGSVTDHVALPELKKDETYRLASGGMWEVVPSPALSGDGNGTSGAVVTEVNNGDIEITELMTDNNCYAPVNGDYYSYVEIHNRTDRSIDLTGMYLSDNAASPRKWAFPSCSIAPDEYKLIYCSGLNTIDGWGNVHTAFDISSRDGALLLSSANGTLLSRTQIPVLTCGQSYSLVEGSWVTSLAPTPRMANSYESAVAVNSETFANKGFPVMISEIAAAPSEQSSDWIELYNNGSSMLDLEGYYLSDDVGRPRSWAFPQGTVIAPGEYLLICAVGSDGSNIPGYVCAPFALSSEGGYTVSIADQDGNVLDAVYLSEQHEGISYGRSLSGKLGYFTVPTPGSQNSADIAYERVSMVEFSVPGALHSSGDAFSVSLSVKTPGARIYYTTDCTDPTESSQLYTGNPISVTGSTIIRAVAFKEGCLPSISNTQSYLYDIPNAADVKYVISLVSDPDGLYSEERGIMVKGPNAYEKFPYGNYGKGANYWMDWPRESHIEMFTTNGTAISQECDISIRGRNTRAYELKGFKVKPSKKYGDGLFRYPLFDDRPYTEYNAMILRYTGQDYKYTFMRDPVIMSLAENLDIMYMEAEISLVYINGKYYSPMYVRESMNAYAICRKNGWPETDKDALEIVKSGLTILQGNDKHFKELKDWLSKNDPTTQEAYDYIDERIDIDSYIDYICMIAYSATPDTVNVKRYRNPNADGKWRWILYDVDRGLRQNIDPFALLAQGTTAGLFIPCAKNPIFVDKLLKRLNELLANDFRSDNVLPKIEKQAEILAPILPDYLKMFDLTMKDYNGKLRSLKNSVTKRPGQIIAHAKNYFKLSDSQTREYFADAIAAIGDTGK